VQGREHRLEEGHDASPGLDVAPRLQGVGERENEVRLAHGLVEELAHPDGEARLFQVLLEGEARGQGEGGIGPEEEHDSGFPSSHPGGELLHVPERPDGAVVLAPCEVDPSRDGSGNPLDQRGGRRGFQAPRVRRSDPAGDHERTLRGGEAIRDLLQRLRRDPRFPGGHLRRRPGQGGEEIPGQRPLRGLPVQDLPEQEGEEAPFLSRPEDEPAVRVGPGERHMGLHVVPEEIAPGPRGGNLPRVGDGGDVGFEEVRADRQQVIGLLDPVMGEVPFAEQEAVRLLFGGVAIHLVFGKPLDPEFFAGGVDEP
jgi:hypothetical protein